MEFVWNIYEPADPTDIHADDPFDVFVYAQRMAEAPHVGGRVYVEGRNCRILACRLDVGRTEAEVRGDVTYYKVCAVGWNVFNFPTR